MDVLIAGGTGYLGSRLTRELQERGHDTTVLTRGVPSPGQAPWDPAAGRLDQDLVDRADVVVGLTGSPLMGIPWTRAWQERMTASRVPPTELLAEAVARAPQPPAFVTGNGSSWYGDHGSDEVTEESASLGDAFMTQLTRDWQQAADPAVEAGSRVCFLRTAPVMSPGSEALTVLVPLFKLGLGARLGDGRQFFPLISLDDWVAAAVAVIEHDTVSGPVNLCTPSTPTNAEFTEAFARLVRRPAFLRAPSPVLRVGAGPAAPELLRSMDLRPAVLEGLGHRFEHPDVGAVLSDALR